jgi:hypothetical protein
MSTPQTILEWLATAPGVAMNPDGHYGLQCVDLVDQYAQDIFEVPWNVCVGGVAGAKSLLDRAPDEYWIRTDNNPNDPNLVPSQGDVVVFSGSAMNEWGHTAVVDSADSGGMWVIQQDGFAAPLIWADGNWYSGKPAHRMWLTYSSNGTGPISGWLTPRRNKLAQQDTIVVAPAGNVTSTTTVAANQRITAGPVNQRAAANVTASLMNTFPADTILDFKGFVFGEGVDGNAVWFVGAYSDSYFWSGGFTNKSADGLPDLTPYPPLAPPAPSLSPYQRTVGSSVIRYRKAPNTSAEVIIEYQPGDVLSFGQWTHGQPIDGNDIWFKGAISGGYAWSGGFEDQSTNGLPEEAISQPVTPEPAPSTPKTYSFTPDFDFVEYIPVALVEPPNEKFTFGNFPDKPEYAVIHQFGTLGRDTIGSLINTFTNPTARQASAHFAVSGKRIVQMVSLKDRAYHAGTVGNNYIGIETDPAQDADTIASTKKLLAALKEKYGYELKTILHQNVPDAKTNCGDSITLSKYKLDTPIIIVPVPANPEPSPTDIPTTPVTPAPNPVPEPVDKEAIIDDFLNFLKESYLLKK